MNTNEEIYCMAAAYNNMQPLVMQLKEAYENINVEECNLTKEQLKKEFIKNLDSLLQVASLAFPGSSSTH